MSEGAFEYQQYKVDEIAGQGERGIKWALNKVGES
jgi:hypothetical protein